MRKMIHKNEEVIYIEYCDGIPNAVITCPLDGKGLSSFDFEFIRDDKTDLAYYDAGMGGRKTELQAPHFVDKKGKAYWMAGGAKFKGRSKAKNCVRINFPLRVKGYRRSSINPFKVSWRTSYRFEYCNECNQVTCDGDGCPDHQHWSDDEGYLVYNIDNSRVE